MNFDETKEHYWNTGHFRNPDHPETWNVTKADLPKIQETDKVYHVATQSYQEYLLDLLAPLAFAFHKRPPIADGDPGPATAVLLDMPRCMMPDFHVPDDPDLDALWAKPEEANWPGACRKQLVTGRSFDSLPGLNREQTDGIWWASCHNWTESIEDLQMTPGPVGQSSGAHFYADVKSLSGSILAWSYLARNSCAVQLAQAYNSRVNWGMPLAATTKTHEDGHALGLNHISNSQATMYPSIHQSSTARLGYPHSSDIAGMQALGYRPHPEWQSRKPSADQIYKPRGDSPVPPDPTPPTGSVFQFTKGRIIVTDKQVLLIADR